MGRGGRRAPARGSTRRPSFRFSTGRSGSGGRRRASTATSRRRSGPRGKPPLPAHPAVAGCAGSPRSASALPRTAGQSPRRVAEQPQPGWWERRESVLCRPSFISARLSQRWRSWTTIVDITFRGTAPWLSSLVGARSVDVRSSCINPGSGLPSCICLSALAGEPAGSPWHAGQRLPGPQHYKLWLPEQPSAYRLWTGDADDSSKWRRFAGTSAPRPLSPPGECPRTPWQPRRRG